MSDAPPVAWLDHVGKTYHAGQVDVAAIRDISLDDPRAPLHA